MYFFGTFYVFCNAQLISFGEEMIQNSKSIHPSRLDEFMCWYYRLSVLKLNSIRSDQQIVERKKGEMMFGGQPAPISKGM